MENFEKKQNEAKKAIREGRFDDAFILFQELIDSAEGNDEMVQYSDNMNMCVFLESFANHDSKAEPYREAAVKLIKQTGGYGASEVAENIRGLADLKQRLGKLDEAYELNLEAEAVYPINTQQEAAEISSPKAR